MSKNTLGDSKNALGDTKNTLGDVAEDPDTSPAQPAGPTPQQAHAKLQQQPD